MAPKNTISQLDLVLLGRRGLTARLGSMESQVKRLSTGSGGDTGDLIAQDLRPNLLTNSSFEYYDRGSTRPQDWAITGSAIVSVGSAGADGTNSLLLPAGASVTQQAAAGLTVPHASVVISAAARSNYAGQKIAIGLTHAPGYNAGPVMRIDLTGGVLQTDDLPADGNWYRFYRSFILTGGNTASAVFAQAGTGTLEIDAVKLEKEDGISAWLEPTAFVSADWGAATHIRNLAADNIVTGTLVVGGSISANPRISVKDGADVEIVVIGDPLSGYYGIEIKGEAGLLISGTGSAEVSGGGSIAVNGGGSVQVTGGGDITVNGGDILVTNGSVSVSGTGGILVSGGGNVTIGSGGDLIIHAGGNATITGALWVGGEATIGGTTLIGGTATIGGNLLMGAGGLFRIGDPAGKRFVWAASGMEGYNELGDRRMFLDIDTVTWRIFGEDAVVLEGDGSLRAGELAWVDSAGFWAVDDVGNAAFGVSGLDAHLWGGIVLDKGDVLLGDSNSYLLWDASTSKVSMNGDLSTGGGKVVLNGIGITIEQGTGNTSQLKWTRPGAAAPNSYISANWNGSAGGQSQLVLLTQNPLNNSAITVQNWVVNTGSVWLCWVGDDYGSVAHATKLEVYSKGSGVNNGMVFTDGALKVGGTVGAYPVAGSITASSHIYSGGNFYPGGAADCYFGRWGASTPFISGNVVIGSGLYPSGQGSYSWTVSGAEMTTNAHLRAQNNLYIGASQAARYFHDDGTYTRFQGSFVVDGDLYMNGWWMSSRINQALLTNSNVSFNTINNNHYLLTGSTGVQYIPNSGNWNTGGTTLVLNGADYSSIGFHDAGSRVDFIRVGAGQIDIGYDGGWGNAKVAVLGNLGAGTAPFAAVRFSIMGATSDGSQYLIYGNAANSTNKFYVRNDGAGFLGAAAWAYSSDRRLKENIVELGYGLDEVLALNTYLFDYTEGAKGHYGFMADEVNLLMPELVGIGQDGMLTLRTTDIIPVLVNAVKELKLEIEALKSSR